MCFILFKTYLSHEQYASIVYNLPNNFIVANSQGTPMYHADNIPGLCTSRVNNYSLVVIHDT